jgi:AraC-like DNA-binding protein
MFEDLIRGWDGEFVASRFDEPSSTWMFVGVHSTALGPGFGGTRMKVYPAPDDALADVLRLSSAMTFKNAMAGLPFGGGKSVLAVPAIPDGDARTELLERYADFVASLGGSYVTACDMNTTEADMDVVGERCPHVMGRSVAAGGSGTSAPDTAVGVYHGIRAGLARALGSDDPSGKTIVVEGAGAVGGPLCDLLADAGATLVVSDVVADRAKAVAVRVGAAIVEQHFEVNFCLLMFLIPDDFVRSTVREIAGSLVAAQAGLATIKSAVRVENDVALSAFFQSMRTYFSGKEKPSEPLVRLKVKELIVSILTSGRNPALAAYFRHLGEGTLPSVVESMEANFRFNLSLEEYARLCHRSLSSFKRDFQTSFQESPGKWLLQKRLDYSAALLRTSKMNVTEIAFESGFEDVSHFSRVFKDRFDVPPMTYRQAGPSTE